MFFIGGVSGAFFAPLALSYGLAVLASMLVALSLTPALCSILLSRDRSSGAGVTLADSLALATSVSHDGGPVLYVANPNGKDMLIPGSLIMSGVAFDDTAETGLGVDRVSVFLGDRDTDGKHLGDARLGGHNTVTDDPQFASGGWTLRTPPLLGTGQKIELFVYARSTVNGKEVVVTIPITVGDHTGVGHGPDPGGMLEE